MTVLKNESTKELIHAAIFFILFAAGWVIPPIEPITEIGMRVIFLFLAAVYAWTATRRPWPSLLVFILIPFTGVITLKELLGSTFGNDTVIFSIFLFVVIGYMESTKVSDFVCYWMLSRKFLNGHPWRIVFMFLLTGLVLSALCGNIIVACLLTWAIFYALAETLGYKPYDKFCTLMIIFIALAGSLATQSLPWAARTIIMLGTASSYTGLPPDLGEFALYAIPLMAIDLCVLMLLLKFVFRLDVSRLQSLEPSFFSEDAKVFDTEKKMALTIMSLVIIMILLPSFIPSGSIVAKFLNNLGLINKIFILIAIFNIITIKNKAAFDLQAMGAKINWNVCIMLATIYGLIACIGNSSTGINEAMVKALGGLDGMGRSGFISTLVILCEFFTNVLSNLIVAVTAMIPALSVGPQFGLSPETASYMLTVSSSYAYITPAASGTALMMFSNSQWVRPKDVVIYGGLASILFTAILIIYTIVLW